MSGVSSAELNKRDVSHVVQRRVGGVECEKRSAFHWNALHDVVAPYLPVDICVLICPISVGLSGFVLVSGTAVKEGKRRP